MSPPAIQARVWQHFAGSPLAFITWLDKTLGEDPQGGATAAAWSDPLLSASAGNRVASGDSGRISRNSRFRVADHGRVEALWLAALEGRWPLLPRAIALVRDGFFAVEGGRTGGPARGRAPVHRLRLACWP